MLSDIEKLDILLRRNDSERERERDKKSVSSNFGKRPDSPFFEISVNQNTYSHSSSREA